MRKTVVALVLLVALALGASTAGPAPWDSSPPAVTTSGAQVSPAPPHQIRPLAPSGSSTRPLATLLPLLSLLLAASTIGALALRPDSDGSVLGFGARGARGPPAPQAV